VLTVCIDAREKAGTITLIKDRCGELHLRSLLIGACILALPAFVGRHKLRQKFSIVRAANTHLHYVVVVESKGGRLGVTYNHIPRHRLRLVIAEISAFVVDLVAASARAIKHHRLVVAISSDAFRNSTRKDSVRNFPSAS
jgi:hypothetical protein